MVVSEELKPCPCGQTPDCLEITDIGQGTKWALAVPGCCGEWSIEFRTEYYDFKSEECMKLAIEAWNEAPRANNIEALLETKEKYNELIMAVARKFPDETRHETALRYINSCERLINEPCAAQDKED